MKAKVAVPMTSRPMAGVDANTQMVRKILNMTTVEDQ